MQLFLVGVWRKTVGHWLKKWKLDPTFYRGVVREKAFFKCEVFLCSV